jgi:hypothetical protein
MEEKGKISYKTKKDIEGYNGCVRRAQAGMEISAWKQKI